MGSPNSKDSSIDKSKLAKNAASTLLSEGPFTFCKKILNFLKYYTYEKRHPFNRRFESSQDLLNQNGTNICYNSRIKQDYDPSLDNILVAIESPAVVEHNNWFTDDMEFEAEISFGNFYDLNNYYCPRNLYSTNDFYMEFKPDKNYSNKNKLVSIIASNKKSLPGHKLRHQIIDDDDLDIDEFGSGSEGFVEKYWSKRQQSFIEPKRNSLNNYMFQVVVENGKYPEYVSEKFYDCIKAQTIPIYWGGEEAVRKMGFDLDGVLFFDDIEELDRIIDYISKDLYDEMRPAIERNQQRLREIRNQCLSEFYLNSVRQFYLHTMVSYHQRDYDKLMLKFLE